MYYNNKSAAYIEMGDLDKALEQLDPAEKLIEEKVIKDFVKIGKVYARKASIFNKKKDLDKAKEYYEKSLLEDNVGKVRD